MGDVFISYSRKDRFFAELLALKLEEAEIKVWRDKSQLQAGDDWRAEIDYAIEQCKLVLILLSPASANSGYVTYEWARAFGHGKPHLQIMLEHCDRHPRLEGPQYADFTEDHMPWAALMQSVRDRIDEAESLTDDQDAPPSESASTGLQDAPHPDIAALGFKRATLCTNDPEKLADYEKAAKEILGYLDKRGYQMVSNDRIRKRIDPSFDDDFLAGLRRSMPHLFRRAMLKGTDDSNKWRIGLKKV